MQVETIITEAEEGKDSSTTRATEGKEEADKTFIPSIPFKDLKDKPT